MTVVKLLVPVILTAMLFLSGCSKQPPVPTIPDASITIIETTLPEVDVTGAWVLDYETTQANLQNYESLQEMFGTGLQEGNGLTIGADGSFDYYIGISRGGEGTYVVNGGEITAEITPYWEGDTELSLTVLPEGEQTFLVMELFGEKLYWKRA